MSIFQSLHEALNNRKYKEAINMLNSELEKFPDMVWVKRTFIVEHLIILYCKTGQTDEAYKVYNDFSATVDPDNIYLLQIKNRFYDLIFA